MDISSSPEVIDLVNDIPDSTRHPAEEKDTNAEDIFRCETQMIGTYGSQEYRNPETRHMEKIVHAFSFCNHTSLPDDMLVKVVRETWEDLFALTGIHDSSLADEWPDRINYVHSPTSGVEKLFDSTESKDDCKSCDLNVLRSLTKYHLGKKVKHEDQEGNEDSDKQRSDTTGSSQDG